MTYLQRHRPGSFFVTKVSLHDTTARKGYRAGRKCRVLSEIEDEQRNSTREGSTRHVGCRSLVASPRPLGMVEGDVLVPGWNGARDIATYSSIVAELRATLTGILYMVRSLSNIQWVRVGLSRSRYRWIVSGNMVCTSSSMIVKTRCVLVRVSKMVQARRSRTHLSRWLLRMAKTFRLAACAFVLPTTLPARSGMSVARSNPAS